MIKFIYTELPIDYDVSYLNQRSETVAYVDLTYIKNSQLHLFCDIVHTISRTGKKVVILAAPDVSLQSLSKADFEIRLPFCIDSWRRFLRDNDSFRGYSAGLYSTLPPSIDSQRHVDEYKNVSRIVQRSILLFENIRSICEESPPGVQRVSPDDLIIVNSKRKTPLPNIRAVIQFVTQRSDVVLFGGAAKHLVAPLLNPFYYDIDIITNNYEVVNRFASLGYKIPENYRTSATITLPCVFGYPALHITFASDHKKIIDRATYLCDTVHIHSGVVYSNNYKLYNGETDTKNKVARLVGKPNGNLLVSYEHCRKLAARGYIFV